MLSHFSPQALRQKTSPQSFNVGTAIINVVTYDFTEAYTATHFIEMAEIKPFAQLSALEYFSTGLPGAATVDVGLMTGTFADQDSARTFDDLLISAGGEAAGAATTPQCFDVAVSQQQERGIGIRLSSNVAAGAGSITLVMTTFHRPGG